MLKKNTVLYPNQNSIMQSQKAYMLRNIRINTGDISAINILQTLRSLLRKV